MCNTIKVNENVEGMELYTINMRTGLICPDIVSSSNSICFVSISSYRIQFKI